MVDARDDGAGKEESPQNGRVHLTSSLQCLIPTQIAPLF